MSYRMVSGWRIASLAAIVGLLGSGVAGLAIADAPGGPAVSNGPASGSRLLRLARQPQTARTTAGMRLLQEAAAACAGISYSGEQVVLWWGQRRASTSVVQVWHQRGRAMLVQPAAPRASAGISDPDDVLGVSDRLLVLLRSNYEAVYAGRGSAVGRPALVVEVRRPGGGLAARFWLDAATKLPLRREVFATGSHMLSEDAFTTLELGADRLGGMPDVAVAPWTAQLGQERLAALRARGWPLPRQLPGNLVLFAAMETPARAGQVIDLSYSDGLAVVSLFVQRGELARSMPGWRQIGVAGRTVSIGPDQRTLAWSGSGFVYTVIADAPMATVSQVVAALPAGRQPGFWERIARGLRRLVSWLNPLR